MGIPTRCGSLSSHKDSGEKSRQPPFALLRSGISGRTVDRYLRGDKGVSGGCLAVVQAQIINSVGVGLPAIRICAGQCSLPRHNYRIYNLFFDWPGDRIKARCHFCTSYPWNIFIIDLYSLSATLAKHPRFLSHNHTIHLGSRTN
jgi:hypothetical protein